jgi:hypothetical protein
VSGVIRSWQCLNARCHNAFQAWESNPACPKCRCVRVSWIPGGGHVAGTARAADAELRTLADNYGLTNLNSAQEGRGAKIVKTPPPAPQNREAAMQFAPGFAQVPYVRDRQGGVHSVCAPSMQNVNFKTRVGAEVPLGGGKMGFASPISNTRFEGTHRAKAG